MVRKCLFDVSLLGHIKGRCSYLHTFEKCKSSCSKSTLLWLIQLMPSTFFLHMRGMKNDHDEQQVLIYDTLRYNINHGKYVLLCFKSNKTVGSCQ